MAVKTLFLTVDSVRPFCYLRKGKLSNEHFAMRSRRCEDERAQLGEIIHLQKEVEIRNGVG